MKILPVFPCFSEFFHADRHTDQRTDTHDEANTYCSRFYKRAPDYKLYCTLCNYCTNGAMFRRQEACMITRQCSMASISYLIVIRFNGTITLMELYLGLFLVPWWPSPQSCTANHVAGIPPASVSQCFWTWDCTEYGAWWGCSRHL